MLQDTIQRLSAQRALCKLCGVFLGIGILFAGALERLSGISLLWIGAPLLLLGLADAGYAAEQRRCAEVLKNQKGKEELSVLPAADAVGSIRGFALALLAFSVWPFYAALLGLVAAGAFRMPIKEPAPLAVTVAGLNGNMPMQPYRQPAMGSMPPQYLPPNRPGSTPFPVRPPMNPAFPHNGPAGFPPPNIPVTRPTYPGIPNPAVPPSPAAPPAVAAPAGK